MPYEDIYFTTNETLSSEKMNKLKGNVDLVKGRTRPLCVGGGVPKDGYKNVAVRFPHINPNNTTGEGLEGVTYTILARNQNILHLRITIPAGVFSATPLFLGDFIHAQLQFGIMRGTIWDESATGFCVAFIDVGGPEHPIETGFGYTAYLSGPYAGNPW